MNLWRARLLLSRSKTPNNEELKAVLLNNDPEIWVKLAQRSLVSTRFEDLFFLSNLRRKAISRGIPNNGSSQEKLRLAVIGACSLYPLLELVEHLLAVSGRPSDLFAGEFDGYVSEIIEESSELYAFKPEVVFVIPSERRYRYRGRWSDPRELQQAEAMRLSTELLDLCSLLHQRTGTEVILGNFILPAYHDPGPYRTRTLGSDWNFRKVVNLELGLNAPAYVHICDLEFLATRRGGLISRDDRGWLESKQPAAPDLLVDIAREVTHIVGSLRTGPKKVLVLDLDNTLWGGIVGDDGVEGIEIGGTSARGEAFRVFQSYVLSLTERGILLAVCSKNDHDKAVEPFEKHPEMVLRLDHIVSFKANWNPKPDNLRLIAAELGLGLDSLVFLDDDPMEIDIVSQFTPEVSTLLVGPDPADYVMQLQDARLFEPIAITAEDARRTEHYRKEATRKTLRSSSTDLSSYLESLEMVGTFTEFNSVDVPRITQLINKSNQFNTTTRRRTESEVRGLLDKPNCLCFTMRLIDRFDDYGLISVVIGMVNGTALETELEVDTWLMSCRVLNRQVEEEVMNEVARLARLKSCAYIRGIYIPSARNQIVRDLYLRLGFASISETDKRSEFCCPIASTKPFVTKIRIARRAYDSS